MNSEQHTPDMTIQRQGEFDVIKGPADWFTGDVHISSMLSGDAPSRVAAAVVNFTAGARTHWHTHPLGQILYVTKGKGWTQCENGPKKEIREGDLIWCNCGRRHWHGATESENMQHVAIQEALDGKPVDWFEAVTDEQYLVPVEQD